MLLVLAVLAVGLALGLGAGLAGGPLAPGRRRRDGRAVRGDAGPRPAQRPGARPRPAARLVAGRVPPPRRRSCGARPARCRPRCAVPRCAVAGASSTCDVPSSWPGWSTGATSASRSPSRSTRAPDDPTWWSTWSAGAAWSSTPRCRSTPTSTRRRPTTTGVRDDALARHVRQLRHHVDQLGSKAYWRSFAETPEFVVLFVPAESFLAVALETDAGLIDYAASRQVVLASPTTLIALLRTVAHGWSHEAIAERAGEIHRLGRDLHDRLGTLGGHLDQVGPLAQRGRHDLQPGGRQPGVPGAGDRPPVRRPRGHRRRAGHAAAGRGRCSLRGRRRAAGGRPARRLRGGLMSSYPAGVSRTRPTTRPSAPTRGDAPSGRRDASRGGRWSCSAWRPRSAHSRSTSGSAGTWGCSSTCASWRCASPSRWRCGRATSSSSGVLPPLLMTGVLLLLELTRPGVLGPPHRRGGAGRW